MTSRQEQQLIADDDDDRRAAEYQAACTWAAEQAMLADEEYMSRHGVKMP